MKKQSLFGRNRSGSKSNRRDGALQRTRRIGFELLESRCLLSSIGFSAISNVTVPSGQTIFVPLDSSDSGNTVSYTVTASDYSKLTPVMMPSTNKSVQFNVLINGVAEPMTFQLFDNLVPTTTAQIESLVTSGFYNGLEIYRNDSSSSTVPVLQGGNDPLSGAISTVPSSGGDIAEQFNPNLQFTTAGILAMARQTAPSTSSTEFFITTGAARDIDYNYTIFGFQTAGMSVDQAIEAMSTYNSGGINYLNTPVTIQTATILSPDTQNGVLELTAPKGVTGTVTVTVTANDGTNTATSQSFVVTIAADSASNPANPFASVIPAAPTGLKFIPPSDGSSSVITDYNNTTTSKALEFQVTGVTSGNTVEILADGRVVGQNTATGTTDTVYTDGSTALGDGPHTFTAIQVAPNQTVSVTETGASVPSSQTANAPSLNSPDQEFAVVSVVPSGYSITADDSSNPIDTAEASSAGFTFAGAQVGATYNYSITSSAGGTAVTGSGTVTSATQDVTNVTVASLPNGTLTYSVILTNPVGAGTAVTATATLAETAPSGYTIVADPALVTTAAGSLAGFTFAGAQVGATYNYTITSSAGGTPVTGSATVTSATQQVSGISVAALSYGTLTYSVTLTNGAGTGSPTTATGNFVEAASSLSGYVYIVSDYDNPQHKSTDTGVAGVTVRLYVLDNGNWTEVVGSSPVQTGSDGSYSFSQLLAGTYKIEKDPPGQLVDGQVMVGTAQGTAGVDMVDDIQLAGGQAGTNYNFGILGLPPSLVSLRLFMLSTPSMSTLFQNLHTAPTVSLGETTGTSASPTAYTTTGSPVSLAPAATISSPGSSTIASLTVTITDLQDGSSELLTPQASNSSITATYGTGTVTFSGVADVSAYQTLLQSIQYSDVAASPTAGSRTIEIVVNDGTVSSSPLDTVLSVVLG